jgi:hypothetical protein
MNENYPATIQGSYGRHSRAEVDSRGEAVAGQHEGRQSRAGGYSEALLKLHQQLFGDLATAK